MMKTNCGGLLNPTAAGWLLRCQRKSDCMGLCNLALFTVSSLVFVWLVFIFPVFFSRLVGWHSVLPDLSLVFSGMSQTVWLMDSLLFGSLTRWCTGQLVLSLSISVSRGRISLSLSRLSVRLWCNQLKLGNTGSAVTPPSWTHLQ